MAPDSLESRIGQAMHRLLEWAPWTEQQLARAGQAFALDAAQTQNAAQMALAILQGEGAWAWDTQALQWHANEVAITHQGRVLRMDRLVQRGDDNSWWVLDYKSTARPQEQAELRAQLLTYRSVVQLAYPGQTVRAAFLTPQGRLIELTPDIA